MDPTTTVGVDIGGTNTVVGIVSAPGVCLRTVRFPTIAAAGAREFVPRLAHAIHDLLTNVPSGAHLHGIGIASPAANCLEGTIDNPANLNWGRVPIVEMMEALFHVPVAVTNDASAAALGELHYGTARGMKDFVVVTLGTGVGAGVVVEGRLLQGAHGLAAELGHTTHERNGRLCACGRRGCVEAYVSASGLCRTTTELLAESDQESTIRGLDERRLTAELVFQHARNGDQIARMAFATTGGHLGSILSNVAAVFDPEAIILSGGLVNAGDFLLTPTRAAFEHHLLEMYKGKSMILASTLNDGLAAVLGASTLVHTPVSAEETVN